MNRNDFIVKERHRREAFETAARTGREPNLSRGPGHICIGSIFDCSRKTFEKALTNYWDKLFVGWNPYKRDGRGCWEVWQKPISKKKLSNFEHWVADLEFLNLSFIDKLRSMDAWDNKNLAKQADEDYEEYEKKLEKIEEENLKYVVKHNKSTFGKLKELAADGYNPLWFFSDKKQGNGQV